MGAEAALGLGGYAAYNAIKAIKKKDDDSSDTTAEKADTTDSAATGSQTTYDGMLSEDAVAKAKKKRASTGTMADEGKETFGGGALGA